MTLRRPPRSIRHPVVAARRRAVLPRWVRQVDAAAGRRINARVVHPRIDAGYRALSHAANRGTLWTVIAALLALSGRRRAAARGLVSLTAASIVANLIGKRVFGGDRPLLKDIPIGRRLRRSPTSGSFPSGHSASAAAFTAGVALESPGAGASIAPLAAAVAYSRLHVGAHWLSDVLGGAGLGAAVAVMGKLLVPAKTAHPFSPPTASPIQLPALPDGRGAFIVVNPTAGTGAGAASGEVIARRLPGARVHTLREGEDLGEVLRTAVAADQLQVLGICGGDGSVAATAHLAREAGLPLAVFPGGTFNHFALALGVESIQDTVEAVTIGRGHLVDVAELSGATTGPITVVNTASVGIYPRFVAERERREPRLGKWLAGLVSAVSVLTSAGKISLTLNGRQLRVWSVFIGVNRYYPADAAPSQRIRLDDGVLDVRVLHAAAWARTSGIVALALGRRVSALLQALRPAAIAIETFTTDAVDLLVDADSRVDSGIAHDGEAAIGHDRFRVTARILPRALRVYSPR
ncbi:phosphatase PAP2 family protein [Parafrigoribacterium mesophilum]|uniref:phosphatase PAP2 family protein n=1 Tax=Parafrigoribacterium mesophilum TaxID=433646 RepID=UPI0031FDE990